jgi:hypothetical protein
MHAQVLDWLARQFDALPGKLHVFEIGSRTINGSARSARHPAQVAAWWGCDLVPGAGVDYVGPGEEACPPWPADVVVCCEVLEHTPLLRPILANAAARLHEGGVLLLTMATEPRAAHSAVDGAGLRHGEYYENVEPDTLAAALAAVGCLVEEEVVDRGRGDLYVRARKLSSAFIFGVPEKRC